jgi:hypothetical protein
MRQVCHRSEGRDAVAVNPPEDLASSKGPVPALLEDVLESRPLELGKIEEARRRRARYGI